MPKTGSRSVRYFFSAIIGAVIILAGAPAWSQSQPIVIKFTHVVAPNTPKGKVFDLPYAFPDKAVLKRVIDGPIGQGLLQKLQSKGLDGLAYWDNGFKDMTANRPLRKPDDFRGLKMRIQSSKVLEAQMRALGALPQVMAFSEVYQAMQTGVVDGNENTPSNIYTQKVHEVQKHLTVSEHGSSVMR
jgi:C4-dicarboxylate-binding protein DctP